MIAIASVDQKMGLGREGELLVRFSEDLKRFKQFTKGNVVIYGRKTLATYPKQQALPGRINLMLSSQAEAIEGIEIFPSIPLLMQRITELKREGYDDERLFVVGGASIYTQLLPWTHKLLLTEIEADLGADSFFPGSPESLGFSLTERSETLTDQNTDYHYATYERNGAV